MNNKIAWILLASVGSQLMLPIAEAPAITPQASKTMLLAEKGNRGGGGGNRTQHSGGGGGNRAERSGGNLNRASVGGQGSGRVQRDTANRPSRSSETRQVNRENVNRSGDRQTSNRIERPQAQNHNIDRNQTRDRVNNQRDVNVNRDRTVNVDRNRTVNVDRNRTVNVDRNRNVVVNPHGGTAWGWNRGVAWVPRTNYWGGGFWGPYAVGAATVGMTSAIVNASSRNYYSVEQNSPGHSLLSNYGLIQTQCSNDPNLVYMYGPQDSLICANPNSLVPSGDYDINIDTLTLVAR